MISFIADHLEFDPVPVEELEPATEFVIVMPKGFEAVAFDHLLRRIEIANGKGHVSERLALPVFAFHMIARA